MKKLSKEEFMAKCKADLLAREQARIDARTAFARYTMDKDAKYLRRKKKYMRDR